MRWADLDMLKHVNNVVYLDYAAESRALLVEDGAVGPDTSIAEVSVRFVRPLLLTRELVTVASEVSGDVLTQQVRLERPGKTLVFAEITTTYGPRAEAHVQHPRLVPAPVTIRRSDLGTGGAVSPTKLFELFQESRILYLGSAVTTLRPGRFVVGTAAVSVHGDVRWQREPYDARAWVSHVGRGSFVLRAEIGIDDTVLARAATTLVGFDPEAQRSDPFTEPQRAELSALMQDE